MWAAVLSIVYLLGIVSAVDAVMSARTPQGSIAWAVSLVTFPVLAVPAYWVLGRSKFHGMREAHLEHREEIAKLLARILPQLAPAVDLVAGEDPHRRVLEQLGPGRFLRGNRVELLVDGEATFTSILDGIARAERYVLVHFYMFKVGVLGRRMGDALKAKAQQGVRAVLLYDEIGSLGFPAAFRDELVAAGVMVSAFGTTRGRKNRFQLNFRNHRKIVVVDGEHAWVGGHNVGDEYLGNDPKIGPWRDTHVKITGPAALSAQATVVGDWFWATRALLSLDWAPDETAGAASVLTLPSGPDDELETASICAAELCDMAQQRLWIASPYFVPDDAVMSALRVAALRGVDVRIIVPEKSDNPFVDLAARWYMSELSGLGIRFFRYTHGFLHTKTALVDDRTSVVGTVNWDSRSFRLNFEISAIVDDEDLCDQMVRMFVNDFARSREVADGELAGRSFGFRLLVKGARLLSPVL